MDSRGETQIADGATKKPDWVAICSLVVAVAAVAVVVWEGLENREHNRLSAKQMVLAEVTSSHTSRTWGIYLKNEGVGPAIVDFDVVTLDGRGTKLWAIVAKMVEEGVLKAEADVSVRSLKPGTYLGVGSKIPILEVSREDVNGRDLRKFVKFLRWRIDVRYQACSVYGDCEQGSTRDTPEDS